MKIRRACVLYNVSVLIAAKQFGDDIPPQLINVAEILKRDDLSKLAEIVDRNGDLSGYTKGRIG